MQTHKKNNLPRDREGYDGFEYTDEKLSTRRIHWCGVIFYIFFFGELFLKNRGKMTKKLLPRTVGCVSSQFDNTLVWQLDCNTNVDGIKLLTDNEDPGDQGIARISMLSATF